MNLRSSLTARMARHSAQVLAAANLAEKEVLDLETGARGFALTREERFLAPWRSARAALPRQGARLSTLAADNPEQQALAQQIADEARSYVDEYSIPLVNAVRRQDNPPPAAEGKRRVDAIRAQFARFDGMRIVMLTARSQADDRETAREMGADDYITKPFSPIQLLEKVRDVLGPEALL